MLTDCTEDLRKLTGVGQGNYVFTRRHPRPGFDLNGLWRLSGLHLQMGQPAMPRRRALTGSQLTGLFALPAAEAAADHLKDVRIAQGKMRISPLRAATPEEAEALAKRLCGMMPAVRVTGPLAEVDRGIGFSAAFTYLHTGLPADDPRVVFTAVLADATNLGLTRMADEPTPSPSYRQLAWTAGWHLRRCPCAHPETAGPMAGYPDRTFGWANRADQENDVMNRKSPMPSQPTDRRRLGHSLHLRPAWAIAPRVRANPCGSL